MKAYRITSKCLIVSIFLLYMTLLPAVESSNDSICDYSSLIQKYQLEIMKKMRKQKVQGISIALVDFDRVVWEEGFGYADKENNIKATPATKYIIGSVTKLFTALGVMQLQELNKLDINDPLQKHLPQFDMKTHFGDINDITIRSIMTHHGGIPSDIFTSIYCENPEEFTTTVDYINLEYATYPVDFIGSYSNPGYTLLGHMIQEVTEELYTEYIENHIFKPVGMLQSGFLMSMDYPDGFSKAYNSKGKLDTEYPSRDVPAAAIFSNVNDMAKFAISLLCDKNGIVNKKTLQVMLEQENSDIKLDLDNKNGLCWFLEDSDAGLIALHSGATKNHRAMFAIAPESKLGIIILSNSENYSSMRSLYRQILEDAAKVKGFEPKYKRTYPKYPEYKKINRVKFPDGDLVNNTGNYAAPGMCFIIEKKGYKLSSQIGSRRFNLLPLDDGKYLPMFKLLRIIPINLRKVRFYFDNVNGRNILVQEQMLSGSRSIMGERIEVSEITEDWKKRLGNYTLINSISTLDEEIITDIIIKINHDFLVFCCTINPGEQKMEFMIKPINENEGVMMGLGRHGGGTLQFKKNENGEETLLIYGLYLKRII